MPIVHTGGSSLISSANASAAASGQLARSRPGQSAQPRLDRMGPPARVFAFESMSPKPSLAPPPLIPFPFPFPPPPPGCPECGTTCVETVQATVTDGSRKSVAYDPSRQQQVVRVRSSDVHDVEGNQVVCTQHSSRSRWYARTHHGGKHESELGFGAAGNASRNRMARRQPCCTRR